VVDLVKIRKKAKKAAEAEAELKPQPVIAPEPELPIEEKPPEPAPTMPTLTPAASSKLTKFKDEAGKRREGLTVETVEQTTSAIVELLTFVIAGEHYAAAIDNIVEIVTPRVVTRIPNADSSIIGIISLRGTIVTLVDVRGKLRHAPAQASAETRVIVLEHHGESVGFEVDRVLRVVKTDSAAIEPHPVVHMSELDDAIRGVFRQANALTILLDLDKLLDSRGH
jgi:purine-binding chemotaxis protein CheW